MKSTKKKARLVPRFRVLLNDEIALGPGKAELLEEIHETGSISEAAKRLEMSYMRAWKLVKTINACFREPVVAMARGGSAQGGAKLTRAGVKALALYRGIEKAAIKSSRREWAELLRLLRS